MASDSEKTERIGYLCLTLVALGFLLFMFKVDACNSCNAVDCKDEFIAFEGHDNPTCSKGAKAEIVSSPPYPKPGILCRCGSGSGKPLATSPTPAPPVNSQIDAGP